jgi:hypothetical protein
MTDPNETYWWVPHRTGLVWISPVLGLGAVLAAAGAAATSLESLSLVVLLSPAALVLGFVGIGFKWRPMAVSVAGIVLGIVGLGLFISILLTFFNSLANWQFWHQHRAVAKFRSSARLSAVVLPAGDSRAPRQGAHQQ